jgi:uncharacterized membrane protein HdeD (DUF308 family)
VGGWFLVNHHASTILLGGPTMSIMPDDRPLVRAFRHELDALQGNWLWFLVLGIALIVLGVILLGSPLLATLTTTMVFGVMLIVGGVFECVGAFWARQWSGFFLVLLSGVLSVIVGLLLLRRPVEAMVVITLLLACYLMVEGVFHMIAAFSVRYTSWVWPFLSGAVDLVLGLLIWAQWPSSSLWVIGLFVGISLIFRGVSWVMLALALKSLPRAAV